jgi:predicted AAA+ superfamily ATPase
MLIRREPYLKTLRQLRDKNLIKVITGLRRVGKSTLLQLFEEELRDDGVPDSRILSYNFEDPIHRDKLDWGKLYDEIAARLDENAMNYVFLDEVQSVPSFERLVDGLFIKKNVDLYVTGSNAFLLSGELATLLSGRYISINLLPLSFREYGELFSTLGRSELFNQYLGNSTMPEAASLLIDAPDLVNKYLRDIYETVINKDVKLRHEIRDMANFERVTRFILDNIGSFVSAKSIADALNIGNRTHQKDISHNTIDKYLRYLTESFFLYKANRYDIKGKNLLKTQDKYYATDLGFRTALVGGLAKSDLGHKLENLVYLELRRRNEGEIWVGKNGDQEVDFVVQNPAGEREYYQVAWTAHDQTTLERELLPLQKTRDNYQKFLITTDPDNSIYIGIRKINVVDWLWLTPSPTKSSLARNA